MLSIIMKTLHKYLQVPFFALLILIVVGYIFFLLSNSRTFQFFGGLINRVNTDKKVVALTFDDAPSSHTEEVLSILKEKGVRATFYEIGKAIEQYPTEAKSISDAGMEVGNHSYSHSRFLFKSQSFIDSEIQKTNQLIRDSGYQGEITFRPPYGKKLFGLPWYLYNHNIKTIMWDVEPDTYASGNADLIVNYTLENAKPGSIILLHPFCDSCANGRDAIGKIIDGLEKEGYKFVTVSELIGL
jgi:peptidoglycan/xylan/chitin deacetylase (PgdA/CDA1 family)